MSDWFVVNIVDAPALRHEVGGLAVTFEPSSERFPQFGINDLVRHTRSYNRQVTNVCYYWAPNDYFDLTGAKPGWSRVLDKYDVDVIVWGRASALASLLDDSAGWQRVHTAADDGIWVRK